MSKNKDWSVYVLRCADGSLYTGIALDVAQRVAAHADSTTGAKYLRGRGPLRLEFQHIAGDRASATAIECKIKRWPKSKKERMVSAPADFRLVVDSLRSAFDADRT